MTSIVRIQFALNEELLCTHGQEWILSMSVREVAVLNSDPRVW